MHGAGIVSLGFVMDAITDAHRRTPVPSVRQFATGLDSITSECRWSDGYWDFGAGRHIKWCDLQNTTGHIQLLTDHLLSAYRTSQRTRQ